MKIYASYGHVNTRNNLRGSWLSSTLNNFFEIHHSNHKWHDCQYLHILIFCIHFFIGVMNSSRVYYLATIFYQFNVLYGLGCRVMAFNTTFNNISAISWLSVSLEEETGENHRPVASHWSTLSHNAVSNSQR